MRAGKREAQRELNEMITEAERGPSVRPNATVGELLDVAFDEGVLSIERGMVFGPDGLVEKDTKTHAVRRVALDAGTLASLDARRALMGARAEMCGVSLVEDAFVFSNSPDGSEPWFPDSVSRSFKRLCVLEGLHDVRLHDLRHFVAAQLLGAGVDVRTVAGRLGHRNAATTLNVDAHFLEQTDGAAADFIGQVIAGGREGGGR